jgi:mono/diheme cytochrome c family protein
MPEYGDILTSAQIDDLVAYLRAKRKVIVVVPKPPSPTPAPAASESDPD